MNKTSKAFILGAVTIGVVAWALNKSKEKKPGITQRYSGWLGGYLDRDYPMKEHGDIA